MIGRLGFDIMLVHGVFPMLKGRTGRGPVRKQARCY